MDYYTNPPYYLTAYGLAVKYGYQGTEQEFVDELMNGAAHAAEAASVSAAEALAKAQLAETAAGYAAESAAGALESAAAAASSASAASASAEDAADYAGRIADPVGGLVTGWLEENVDPETGYVIDGSLTVSGAAADALKTGAVRDVTNTLLSGGNVGPAVSVTWSQGGISSSSGSTANNDARIRTSIIRGTAAALSIISVHRVDVLVYAYRYSINSSHYVGAVTTDFVPCPADKRILIPLDKGLAYCVVARYPDDADILPAEGSGITIQKFAMARADSSAAAALLGGDKTLTGFDFSWTSGTLSEASGSENTSERVMRTDFLRIVPGSVLKFVGEGGSSRVAFAYYYDEAKSYIKRVDIVGGDSALVPNNAAYVRLTYGYTTASGETLNDGFAEMPKYKISINEDRTQFILDVLGYLPTTVVKGYIRPSGVIAESTGVSSYPVFELPVGRTVKVKIWGPWKYSVMQGDAANNLKKTHRLVTQSEIEVEHPFVGFTFYKYDENGDPVDADPDDFKNEVVLFLGDRATDSAQLTHDVPENIGVLNVINRAYQMAKLTYTAAADLPTQVNTERYPGYVPAGEKVTGVMYSSVRSEGLYVPQLYLPEDGARAALQRPDLLRRGLLVYGGVVLRHRRRGPHDDLLRRLSGHGDHRESEPLRAEARRHAELRREPYCHCDGHRAGLAWADLHDRGNGPGQLQLAPDDPQPEAVPGEHPVAVFRQPVRGVSLSLHLQGALHAEPVGQPRRRGRGACVQRVPVAPPGRGRQLEAWRNRGDRRHGRRGVYAGGAGEVRRRGRGMGRRGHAIHSGGTAAELRFSGRRELPCVSDGRDGELRPGVLRCDVGQRVLRGERGSGRGVLRVGYGDRGERELLRRRSRFLRLPGRQLVLCAERRGDRGRGGCDPPRRRDVPHESRVQDAVRPVFQRSDVCDDSVKEGENMSAEAVIAVARGELGYTEYPPGSNLTKYWLDYGAAMQGQPWCVAFLWWCFEEAGERMAFFGGGKTASCSVLLRWYREQGLTVLVDQVQPGDIVLLNFYGGTEPEHCGLVTDVSYWSDGHRAVYTIEGNTTLGGEGSQDNGGCVAGKLRYEYQIVAVCRPQYKADAGAIPQGPAAEAPPEKEPVDDITGHWAEDSIRRCIERGLMQGYPDGSFQPDKPVTRAELATVLRRLEGG